MSADITEERIAERLGFLADELRSWLKYNEKGHGKTDEELSGDIHVMLSNGYTDAPPCWPSRSVLKHWIGTLDSARSQLAVPTPPQAAPGPAILNPPKQDRDCGDCTRLAICNGELACLCGPTSKMFDRKEPPHPLQPEERRVGPDEVVVGRREWEAAEAFAAKWFSGCDEEDAKEEYNAWLAERWERRKALRTSAQDHNGEGAK